jgi:hypothetical protein
MGNLGDRPSGGGPTRWWRLGILALARVAGINQAVNNREPPYWQYRAVHPLRLSYMGQTDQGAAVSLHSPAPRFSVDALVASRPW